MQDAAEPHQNCPHRLSFPPALPSSFQGRGFPSNASGRFPIDLSISPPLPPFPAGLFLARSAPMAFYRPGTSQIHATPTFPRTRGGFVRFLWRCGLFDLTPDALLSGFSTAGKRCGIFSSFSIDRASSSPSGQGYFLPAARRCWRLRCSSACFIISSILRCHLEGPRVLAF